MGPLHIQGDFTGPPAVRRGQGATAALIEDAEAGRCIEAELAVEHRQVIHDVRVVVGVDDGDGLTRAVGRHAPAGKTDLIEPVGMANLSGGVACNTGGACGGFNDFGIVVQNLCRNGGEHESIFKRLEQINGLMNPSDDATTFHESEHFPAPDRFDESNSVQSYF